MKKLFSFSVIFLLASVFIIDSYAQSFYTGGIGVNLSNFGRVRIVSDNAVTRQVDRSSVLVGVSSTAVFDYTQDAGTVTAASTVGTPTLSDFEVTGVIDNSDSNLRHKPCIIIPSSLQRGGIPSPPRCGAPGKTKSP